VEQSDKRNSTYSLLQKRLQHTHIIHILECYMKEFIVVLNTLEHAFF